MNYIIFGFNTKWNKKMVNVVGKIDGINDEWIIIGSHLIRCGIKFVGANDSGSSTGVLLELARFKGL